MVGPAGTEKIERHPVRNLVKRAYIDFVERTGSTAYRAWKHFRADYPRVSNSQVHRWLMRKDEIAERPGAMRSGGAGRKPLSENMEEILFDYIFQKRMKQRKVKRSLIKKKGLQIAAELGVAGFTVSDGWLRRFLRRYDLTLR